MPDSYAHYYNACEALTIADYTPRNYSAFILGCNAPDIFYYYRKDELFRKSSMSRVGHTIHNDKPGLFLQNLFRFAETNAQKDFCLGWLCHYAMDSIMHPYINYITSAYAGKFNIDYGHAFFESGLDSRISKQLSGAVAADPNIFMPEIEKMYIDQIITLLKHTVEATYGKESYEYDRSDYMQSYNDFRKIKKAVYSPSGVRILYFKAMEYLLKRRKDYIISRIQPAVMTVEDVDIWRNNPLGFFCTATIDELLQKANQLSADSIAVGLSYFAGTYSIGDFLEDIGNKSYITGLAAD